MRMKQSMFHWLGIFLGVAAGLGKAAEAKQPKGVGVHPKKEDGKPHLQVADAIGVFRLGYVDCQPYTGPDQVISIELDGAIECIQQEGIPGVTDDGNRSVKGKREFGRLKTGSLLKGEVQPAPGFRSRASYKAAPVTDAQIQVVNLPGGPGVWFAMRSQTDGLNRTWDEIYVRLNGEKGQEVRA